MLAADSTDNWYAGAEESPACIGDAVWIPGPSGTLQGLTACPREGVAMHGVAVVCHPHPLHGGTMHNKVVDYLSRTLNELGVGTLRFNFRGVEGSDGRYGGGDGEVDDLRAVLEWTQKQRPGHPLWLAGFSFGAYVALRAAHEFPVRQLITVAPPVNFFDFSSIPHPGCPWLLIQGEADEIVPSAAVFDWVAQQRPGPDLIRMSDVGHFFHGRLNQLRSALMDKLAAE